MTNVRDTIANEVEIRNLKKELNYFINDSEMWTQEALKLEKENKRLKQRIGELLNG